MGFWSGLLKNAVGFIPGVGPAVQTAMDIGSQAASGIAKGQAANRTEANNQAVQQDQQRLLARGQDVTQASNAADLALKNQTQARQLSATDYQQLLKAALGMNVQDAKFSRPAGVANISFSGGARPSAIGAIGRQGADVMANLALRRLMDPEAPVELERVSAFNPTAMKGPSTSEKILGGLGLGLGTAAGIGNKLSDILGPKVTTQDVPLSTLKNFGLE